MGIIEQISKKIYSIGANHFDSVDIDNFVLRVIELIAGESELQFFVQLSTDLGPELEFSAFNSKLIIDVTLSRGKIYSCSFPFNTIERTEVVDSESKWTLNIYGDSKLDYNVVKPNSRSELLAYQTAIQKMISAKPALVSK